MLTVCGTLYSLYAPGKSLMIQDDNSRSTLILVITPRTKSTKDGQSVLPTAIKTYEPVSVTYARGRSITQNPTRTTLPSRWQR
jgi:hypothetical protein